MQPHRHNALLGLIVTAALALASSLALADEQQLLAEASKAALKYVAPSIVQIQTVGGREKVEGFIVGSAPTTGLVVSEDGYIVSSAFNFKHDPTTILVSLPSGKNLPAEIVARDKSRMLVLLRVETDEKLVVPTAVPRAEVKTGQFALAMGRTYDSELPSVSVGIISATNRIWGKAIQTDAKVSPANYGGPLTDIRGRVIGVLVPLSAQNSSEVAGAEFYDGGIGFAIPLEDIQRMLPNLIEGKDIFPGKMGITLQGNDIYAVGPPEIAFCPVRSPAAAAGFKTGDKVIRVNDIQINSQAQLKHAIGPLIAGESITLVVLRGDERYEAQIELTEKVDPYILPALGILPAPKRNDLEAEAAHEETEAAVEETEGAADEGGYALKIRYVYDDSPAADAGLQAGDILETADGETPTSLDDWRQRTALLEPGDSLALGYRRGDGELETVEVALREAPAVIPKELPSRERGQIEADGEAEGEADGEADAKTQTGLAQLKLPEEPNECFVWVPTTYQPAVPCGVVIWLGAPGKFNEKAFENRWKSICATHDLIVMAPRPQDKRRWQRAESAIIRKLFDKLTNNYSVDPNRVIVHGLGVGGALGYRFAFENRDVVRGVAPVDAVVPLGIEMRGNDPFERLEFFAIGFRESRIFQRMKSNIEALEKAEFPVVSRWVEGERRDYDDDELEEFGRWTETLERL